MRFDLITIFPEFFAGPLEHGIVRRARGARRLGVRVEDLRVVTREGHYTGDRAACLWGEGIAVDAGSESAAQNESFSAGSILPTGAQYIAPLQLSDEHRASDHQLAESNGLLDYPHYTRPAEFRGWAVPEVLVGGNHAEVAKWRRAAALEKTRRNRPDLLLRG